MVALETSTALWTFPVDLPARRLYFCTEVFSHPAKLHLGLLQRLIDKYTRPGETILDPMAGTGSLMIAATQQRNVILRDIQPEYVDMMNRSLPKVRHQAALFAGLIDIGLCDARALECPHFDHIITSPPYGFEASSESIEARRRRMEKGLAMGRRWKQFIENPGSAQAANGFRYEGGQNNTGNKSGRNYWADMRQIYQRCAELLPSGGCLILVIKNHYRRGILKDVTGQTVAEVQPLGLRLEAQHGRYIDNPSLWQRRRREQGLPIVDVEDVLVFRK